MAPADFDHLPLDLDLADDAALDAALDYSDLEAQFAVPEVDHFETVLVVDGVPVVDEAKRDKLFSVIRKQFAKEGVRIKEHGFDMPMAATGKGGKLMSKGYVFIDFETPADADLALKNLQLFKFDKAHTFFLNRFKDVEKYAAVPDEWDELAAVGPLPPFKEQGFFRDWLLDQAARDQIAVFNKNTVSLLWSNKDKAPEVVHEREGWTEGYVAWSPKGSFLASVHRMGIGLWGNAAMDRLTRFHHPGVRFLDFSPLETYLVTFSPEPLPQVAAGDTSKPWGPESAGHHVCIWHVRTGRLLRSFALTAEEIATKNVPWPLFKWSWDEKYFARIVANAKITVYEAPAMALLDKKSINLPGVTEFDWMPYTPDEDEETAAKKKAEEAASSTPNTPTKGGKGKGGKKGAAGAANEKRNLTPAHVLAYFVPQTGTDNPAQLALMSLPTRQIIRQKQVFFGLGAKIHFHPAGDYVLFKVDRTNRSGKASFVSLEVFRLREKDFPADSVEFKEIITAFAWEPTGNRFAVVTTTDTPNADIDIKTVLAGAPGKMTAHIYEVEAAHTEAPVAKRGGAGAAAAAVAAAKTVPGGVQLVKSFDRRAVNSVFWSPKGRYVVFAGLRNLQGVLEFFDVDAGLDAAKDAAAAGGAKVTTTVVNGTEVTASKSVERVAQLANTEHHGATDLAWDPTGRYVLSTVSMWAKGADNGMYLWDVRGTLLNKSPREALKQALWRPRPPTLLSKAKLKHIRKNIKSYAREFEIADAAESSELGAAEVERRRGLFNDWIKFRSQALLAIEAVEEVETVM
ncbi:Translation initiation factor 3 subunit b [Blastocladiella emersonii ATCC 22665]|nr:Translation initiation factor 3 subunit b [Blastocladiella emersonii ATCC 22665]